MLTLVMRLDKIGNVADSIKEARITIESSVDEYNRLMNSAYTPTTFMEMLVEKVLFEINITDIHDYPNFNYNLAPN